MRVYKFENAKNSKDVKMNNKLHRTIFSLFLASILIIAVYVTNAQLTNTVKIQSTGQISTTKIWAKSGYWRDIQAAVDAVAAAGGGIVHIPEGTWNFINVGESWSSAKVVVPAGVSIFGAPTQRTSGLPYDGIGMNPNDQVVEWRTVLQIPAEFAPQRPGEVLMFRVVGDGSPGKTFRFSDIKVVGYREFNNTSDRWYAVVRIENVIDFRVDHCFFKNTAGLAVTVTAQPNGNCCGVIDHCRFVNDYGYVEWDYAACSVHYGIMPKFTGSTRWEDDITKVVGQYTTYTTFIEDCYFSRWRHCVSSNDGTHYVFRHNTIEKDSVVGSLDAHGTYNYVGTRAMEIYNNLIIDPVLNMHPQNWNSTTPANGQSGYAVNWRGGGGVFFNNYVRNYEVGVYLVDEGTVEKCWPHDIWIWNNTWVNVEYTLMKYSDYRTIQEGVDYFLYAPDWYTPYPYPHPLTVESTS
jgi:hypothetical protein